MLQSYGKDSTNLLGLNKSIRYREGALEAGELVAVLGRGRWQPDPDPNQKGGYRDRAMRLLIEAGEDELLISDQPSTLGA